MQDNAGQFVILCGSAVAAGVINSIAGGGTLLTFPALLGAVGPGGEAVANATSTFAVLPGSLAGAWGYREELTHQRGLALSLLPVSLLGGLLGALLLVLYPVQFGLLIPWLILAAATLFLLQPVLSNFIRRRHAAESGTRNHSRIIATQSTAEVEVSSGPAHRSSTSAAIRLKTRPLLFVFQFFVALYGGYFGAGIGILMLTALGFMRVGNIHRMNAVKAFLATAINSISVVVFVCDGLIHWPYAAAMAIASILGGYAGARLARRLPVTLVRWVVIAIGFGLALYYGIEQYRSH